MTELNRRQFLKAAGAATVGSLIPGIVRSATTRHQVVVVGGGFAGATAAKYLAHWSTGVDVTLVEPSATYYSPILSNLVLNQNLNLSRLGFTYGALAQGYGIRVVQDSVVGVDSSAQRIQVAAGETIPYDRLILAPGIRFRAVSGLDSDKVPHAWKGGQQVLDLQQQLTTMPVGGTFVLCIPAAPYRCPPGPYERACVVADWLQRHKPGSKVVILDANPAIQAEPEVFEHAFQQTYAGVVEYLPNAVLEAVDSDGRVAHTSLGEFAADVLNVIPPHEAGALVHEAGVANVDGRWAGVDPLSYESTVTPHIHIIGDAQGTGQPKAGHIANSEAKVCADAVLRLLAGGSPYATPVTNSACYTPISVDTASWLTGVFAYDPNTGAMSLVPGSSGAASGASRGHYDDMFDWANNLFADTFA